MTSGVKITKKQAAKMIIELWLKREQAADSMHYPVQRVGQNEIEEILDKVENN